MYTDAYMCAPIFTIYAHRYTHTYTCARKTYMNVFISVIYVHTHIFIYFCQAFWEFFVIVWD